jgi:ABC-type phosphonate transport system ATPase subunit
LPFEIDKKVEIMPGNIIAIAGEVNAGKTAFLLNVLNENMHKFEIHYFSSEMGGSELKKRLKKFDYPLSLSEWKFKFKERSDNFGDIIVSGEGKINIIDYLELHDNFFLVAKHLSDIHKRLKGAIAIVAIQKNPGTDTGLGGFRGMEKPRLYLAMSKGKLKIVKAKNWATPVNPNNLEVGFKIVDGCKLIKTGDWHLASSE